MNFDSCVHLQHLSILMKNAFEPDPSAPLSALVFKTLADPFSSRLTLFRGFSGTLVGIANCKIQLNLKMSELVNLYEW